MAVPNRLAQEGEELVAHRFPTGSLGLASPARPETRGIPPPARKTLLVSSRSSSTHPRPNPWLRGLHSARRPAGIAGHPGPLCSMSSVSGPVEEVTFTQISAAVNSYRDAVRFSTAAKCVCRNCAKGSALGCWTFRWPRNWIWSACAKSAAEFRYAGYGKPHSRGRRLDQRLTALSGI